MKIIAVLTSFNRRAQTLAALDALKLAGRAAGAEVVAILVDDASTDGTADVVAELHPNAIVIRARGDLFWNRGMHLGMQEALSRQADYVLWLNDDTHLESSALQRMLAQSECIKAEHSAAPIVVGSTAGADGQVTYGGAIRASRLRPITYRRVWSATEPTRCEVMNGNCVLIPFSVAKVVGNLDPVFEHAMGDIDYALRAGRAGVPIYVASGIVGSCSTNPVAQTFNDRSLPFSVRWRKITHRKGLPWRSWMHFTRRHTGLLWPVYFAWPYLRLTISSMRPHA